MTYHDDYAQGPVETGPARGQFFINLTGAAVSLALVGGMAVWGYKLLVRDVSGVPVIEAIEGAFRTVPDDPGGMTARHQGLSVNRIAAAGEAAPAPDQVALAPSDDTLSEEDWPWGRLVETREDSPGASGSGPSDLGIDELFASAEDPSLYAPVTDAQPGESEDAPSAIDLALAEALDLPGNAAAGADTAAPMRVVTRPAPRPARNVANIARTAAPSPEATSRIGAGELPAAALERGTRLVQLGAYPASDVARAEWTRIGGRFPDFFADKRMVVQQAESGGKTFYRLRAEGFTDLADARRFCSALTARQTDCIPVEVR